MNLERIMNDLEKKNPGQVEYLQAVREVLESIEEVTMKILNSSLPILLKDSLNLIASIHSKICWVDDSGKVRGQQGLQDTIQQRHWSLQGGLEVSPECEP